MKIIVALLVLAASCCFAPATSNCIKDGKEQSSTGAFSCLKNALVKGELNADDLASFICTYYGFKDATNKTELIKAIQYIEVVSGCTNKDIFGLDGDLETLVLDAGDALQNLTATMHQLLTHFIAFQVTPGLCRFLHPFEAHALNRRHTRSLLDGLGGLASVLSLLSILGPLGGAVGGVTNVLSGLTGLLGNGGMLNGLGGLLGSGGGGLGGLGGTVSGLTGTLSGLTGGLLGSGGSGCQSGNGGLLSGVGGLLGSGGGGLGSLLSGATGGNGGILNSLLGSGGLGGGLLGNVLPGVSGGNGGMLNSLLGSGGSGGSSKGILGSLPIGSLLG